MSLYFLYFQIITNNNKHIFLHFSSNLISTQALHLNFYALSEPRDCKWPIFILKSQMTNSSQSWDTFCALVLQILFCNEGAVSSLRKMFDFDYCYKGVCGCLVQKTSAFTRIFLLFQSPGWNLKGDRAKILKMYCNHKTFLIWSNLLSYIILSLSGGQPKRYQLHDEMCGFSVFGLFVCFYHFKHFLSWVFYKQTYRCSAYDLGGSIDRKGTKYS